MSACQRDAASTAAAGRAPQAVPVAVAQVVQRDMPEEILGIGTVEAYSTVTLRPQIDGQLMRAHFQEGQEVAGGDLMLEIDRRPFEAVLNEAQAMLAKDTAMAQDAERAAQQMGDAGQAVSQREADKARAEAAAARGQVQADNAAIESAKLRLEYCSIRSPINGRAGALLVKPGNIVEANTTDLVQINQVAPIYVTFAVPEQHLANIRAQHASHALPVSVTIPGEGGQPINGTLVFIDNQVDSATGTIRLKGLFDNNDRRLWPGQFVNLVLIVSVDRKALTIPSSAVQSGQMGIYVYVVKADRTVEQRVVTVKRTVGDQTVIAQGLTAGETVVTDGHLRLVPGATVEITAQTQPESSGAQSP